MNDPVPVLLHDLSKFKLAKDVVKFLRLVTKNDLKVPTAYTLCMKLSELLSHADIFLENCGSSKQFTALEIVSIDEL